MRLYFVFHEAMLNFGVFVLFKIDTWYSEFHWNKGINQEMLSMIFLQHQNWLIQEIYVNNKNIKSDLA